MAKTNALDDVQAIIGFHNYPTLDIGEFAIKSGPITSLLFHLIVLLLLLTW
jgi:metal-dependent amidase/aminoacylase/carboxypeptidase family protein